MTRPSEIPPSKIVRGAVIHLGSPADLLDEHGRCRLCRATVSDAAAHYARHLASASPCRQCALLAAECAVTPVRCCAGCVHDADVDPDMLLASLPDGFDFDEMLRRNRRQRTITALGWITAFGFAMSYALLGIADRSILPAVVGILGACASAGSLTLFLVDAHLTGRGR